MNRFFLTFATAVGLTGVAVGATGTFELSRAAGKADGDGWCRFIVPFEADLSYSDGFSFDFRCSDLTAAGRPLCYVHGTGTGVYSVVCSPSREGVWERIVVRKRDMTRSQCDACGWAAVRKLRLQFRPTNTNAFTVVIRDVRPLPPPTPAAVIVFPEKGMPRNHADMFDKTAMNTIRDLSVALEKLGDHGVVVSDCDFAAGLREGVRLVLFSGSGGWCEGAYSVFGEYLRRGGKAIAWGEMKDARLAALAREFPAEISSLVGIVPKGTDLRRGLEPVVRANLPGIGPDIAAADAECARRLADARDYVLSQPPRQEEMLVLNCHNPCVLKNSSMTWDDVAVRMKKAGFTHLKVNLCRGIYAAYPSAVLRPWEMAEGRDCLAEAKAACDRQCLGLIAWRCCWAQKAWISKPEDLKRFADDGFAAIDAQGNPFPEMGCPTHPENVRREIESCVELAHKGVAGVNLDFIRYTGRRVCFCERCRRLFESRIGRPVKSFPCDVQDGGCDQAEWNGFRMSCISSVVREIGERIHAECPGVRVSVSGFWDLPLARSFGQDWPTWCREGWIDEVGVMAYFPTADELERRLKALSLLDLGRARLVPIISPQGKTPDTGVDAQLIAEQIHRLRFRGYKAISIFELSPRFLTALDLLEQGPLAPASAEVDETSLFQSQIDAAAAQGGGIVRVPSGRHIVGELRLRSNVELRLERGSLLVFSDRLEDRLPPVRTAHSAIECMGYSPLVYAFGETNVAITGEGTLAARTAFWEAATDWHWSKRPPSNIAAFRTLYHWGETDVPVAERDVTKLEGCAMRPAFLQFNRCKGVRLDGFRIRETPCWTVHLLHSEDIIVRNLDLFGSLKNSDGIDVESSRNVLIEGCRLNQHDDGIVLKSGRDRDGRRRATPTENVEIRNCHVAAAYTLLGIGSEVSGGIRNVRLHGCKVDTCTSRVLQIKTSRRKGAFVEDVKIRDVTCDSAPVGFAIDTNTDYQYKNFPASATNLPTRIADVSVKDVRIRHVGDLVRIRGDASCPARNIRFEGFSADRVTGRGFFCENADAMLTDCWAEGKALPDCR